MFRQAWNLISRVALLIGCFLLFIVAIELFRIFVFFYRIYPVAGWSYLAILLGTSLWAMLSFLKQWRSHPHVLTPPALPASLLQADHATLRAHCKYLMSYLKRLSENPLLSAQEQHLAEQHLFDLDDTLRSHPLQDDLIRAIDTAEQEGLVPILDSLSEQAEAEVRHSVRDVMVGVTLSPYHGMDVLIVIYRNASMILRVAQVYASRPAARDQLLILRDTFRVVATVNILNLGKTLLESLFARVPVIGPAIDDIGQGVGAGLLTSASGHAAMQRCTAFRPWNKEEAASTLAEQAIRFFADVRDLFTKDVLPSMKNRIKATTEPETFAQPGFWDSISSGIGFAVDSTARTLDTLVIKPVVVGGKGVAAAGSRVSLGVARAGSSVARNSHRTYKGAERIFRTFGQRIKYTMRLPGFRK